MPRPYSVDMRERVLLDYDEGVRPVDLTTKYRVSERWIFKLVEQRRQTGSIEPHEGTPGTRPKLDPCVQDLQTMIVQRPDSTVEEHRQKLPIRVAVSTVWKKLHDLEIAIKQALKAAERERPDVALRRLTRRDHMGDWDPRHLVFLDETWAKTNMTRLFGRAPRGTRVIDYVPHGHWNTTTFPAALRSSGLTAPLAVDGAIDGERFGPTCSNTLHLPSNATLSSSWTTSEATKWPGSSRRSVPDAPTSSNFLPTARNSIPSNKSSQNARRFFGRRASAP